jgi:hypothetical protein
MPNEILSKQCSPEVGERTVGCDPTLPTVLWDVGVRITHCVQA